MSPSGTRHPYAYKLWRDPALCFTISAAGLWLDRRKYLQDLALRGRLVTGLPVTARLSVALGLAATGRPVTSLPSLVPGTDAPGIIGQRWNWDLTDKWGLQGGVNLAVISKDQGTSGRRYTRDTHEEVDLAVLSNDQGDPGRRCTCNHHEEGLCLSDVGTGQQSGRAIAKDPRSSSMDTLSLGQCEVRQLGAEARIQRAFQ
ncbi:hypothetical protein DFH06DRAFT_1312404 [Mycena polygramma]|nr:hypothetical protein DFH06DRAFT_1312404 [Mycena polygramma]